MRKSLIVLAALLLLCSAGCSLFTSGNDANLPLQAGLLTDGNPVEDGGINQTVWTCLQQLKHELSGFEAHYKVPGQDGGYSECAAVLAERGCTLIVCVDGTMADTIAKVAGENPNCTFLVLNSEEIQANNVVSIRFSMDEAVYLAGYAAAKTSVSERLGCVHGRMTEETERLVVSFMAGARAANSDITLLRRNIMPQRDGGRLIAEELVANGVDVIFHADGAGDSAVLRVCKENGIWAVGANAEQGQKNTDCMLAYAEKQIETALRQIINEAVSKELKCGARTFDFSNDGITLTVGENILSEKTSTSVNIIREKLAAGEITLPATFEELFEKYPDLTEGQ